MEDGAVGGLPTKQDEEFKPFIRRLPEFKFWHSATRAIAIAFTCTWFSIFDVPVFWPVLVVYWLILFTLTSKFSVLLCIPKQRELYLWGDVREEKRTDQFDSEKTNPAHDQIPLCSILIRKSKVHQKQLVRRRDGCYGNWDAWKSSRTGLPSVG